MNGELIGHVLSSIEGYLDDMFRAAREKYSICSSCERKELLRPDANSYLAGSFPARKGIFNKPYITIEQAIEEYMNDRLYEDKQCGKCGRRNTTYFRECIRDAPEFSLPRSIDFH